MPISSVVAVNPESGEVTKVIDNLRAGCGFRRTGEAWRMFRAICRPAPPVERMRQSLWTCALAGGARPKRVIRLEGQRAGAAGLVGDGKQIILSVGTHDESRKQWVFETFRINADGTGREPLKIPSQDGVQDWSPDGAWVVTTSSRNAKIGWQLYVMHPDGSDQRQVTEGGNPFYARFSPDGRRLLYSDGPLRLPERQGIWVVDLDGRIAGACSRPGKARPRRAGRPMASRSRSRSAAPGLKNMGGSRSSILTARIARS